MKKIFLLTISVFLITCGEQTEESTNSWVFIANEGDLGASNGSISMIDDFGNVFETGALGEIVNALEVYENKLIVLINGGQNQSPDDSKIKIYEINQDGLSMPGIEISTNNSSPRDLVILNDKIYFTNWNSQDIKVFNLFNYEMETSIAVDGLPEEIEFDGQYFWVTIPHSQGAPDWDIGSKVCKIDPTTNSLLETIEVGAGPKGIAFDNGDVYVSRTFYNDSWETFHGVTKISSEITENIYGAGTPCGGAILKHQNIIYRSFDGGLSPMNSDLSLDTENKIGNYDQNLVYHVEEINGNLWFSLTSFVEDYNEIKVIDSFGVEINSYQPGKFPGDFAFWSIND